MRIEGQYLGSYLFSILDASPRPMQRLVALGLISCNFWIAPQHGHGWKAEENVLMAR